MPHHPQQVPAADSSGVLPAELAAMGRALELAVTPGVPLAPNPRVGCVLLDAQGRTLATGYHRGAGTDHAEVAALKAAAAAGHAVPGATAVVTLEPCNHTGRTGPCSHALLAAGVTRVVYAQSDPNPAAAGGAGYLRSHGVAVVGGLFAERAQALNEAWTFAVTHGRPLVTWKVATTLDGRVAAVDGSSRWITSAAARAQVHELRAQVQAVIVGTGTALRDDPSLTIRDKSGHPFGVQPTRVVVGRRDLPAGSKLADAAAPLLHYRDHDPAAVLADLGRREIRHALLEGGPTLAAAFLRAGLVDRIRWYVAPALLGAGKLAVADLGITGIADILRLEVREVAVVGGDLRVDAVVAPAAASAAG